MLVASDGRGFLVRTNDVIAETRKGKAVLNPRAGAALAVVRPVGSEDDYVAAIGENRKLLIFPIGEIAEMSRGQGRAIATLPRRRDCRMRSPLCSPKG